ncbi:hypothetical protein [Alteromonas macleodii]|uniref:hypothetical protein n=1 Tax=Alteromonas macleodii TaxID=28108 RepID=UPI0031406B95
MAPPFIFISLLLSAGNADSAHTNSCHILQSEINLIQRDFEQSTDTLEKDALLKIINSLQNEKSSCARKTLSNCELDCHLNLEAPPAIQ